MSALHSEVWPVSIQALIFFSFEVWSISLRAILESLHSEVLPVSFQALILLALRSGLPCFKLVVLTLRGRTRLASSPDSFRQFDSFIMFWNVQTKVNFLYLPVVSQLRREPSRLKLRVFSIWGLNDNTSSQPRVFALWGLTRLVSIFDFFSFEELLGSSRSALR
jgi:hypothetical protein